MTEHTPGPWVAQPCQVSGCIWIVAGAWPLGSNICELKCGVETQDANANLIAAAPDQYLVGKELHRLTLVIESAVRNADPKWHGAVLALLKGNDAAVAKAEASAAIKPTEQSAP